MYFCVIPDLLDNLTEMCIAKNSIYITARVLLNKMGKLKRKLLRRGIKLLVTLCHFSSLFSEDGCNGSAAVTIQLVVFFLATFTAVVFIRDS